MNKKNKLVIICLFSSLALNMFLGGVLLGRHYDHPEKRFERAWHKKDEMVKKDLSASDRAVLKSVMDKNKGQLDVLRTDLKSLRSDIADAARHNDFDADILRDKMAQENQKRFEILSLMNQMRQDVYADISDDGRDVLTRIGVKPRGFHGKTSSSMGMDSGHDDPDYLPFIWEGGMF